MKTKARRAQHLTVAAVTTLALVAATPAYAGSSQGANERAAKKTVVTLKISGCEGCVIQPGRWIRGSSDGWTGKSKAVKNGKVRWTIRRDRTAGLTFAVHEDPKVGDTNALNAVPLIVTRYKGKKVGKAVSASASRKARRATPCLAGVNRARLTKRVVVKYRKTDEGVVPRYYFARTQKSTKPYSRTFGGTLAAQDVYGCKA